MQAVHPGRILKREMAERGLSANALARLAHALGQDHGYTERKTRRFARDRLASWSLFRQQRPVLVELADSFELARAESEIGSRIAAEVAPPAA